MKKQISSNRDMRVAATVQKFVAEILRDNFSTDKILSRTSIVGAESKGGLQFVRVYYYVPESVANRAVAQKRIDDAMGMIRFELAARMNQKQVPELRFAFDDSLEKGARIEELLANILIDNG